MPRQRHEPSARTLRRWCLALALVQAAQAVAVLLWIVDPAQRTVAAAWAGGAAGLGLLTYRVIPDSTERRPKPPRDRKREMTGEDWREFFAGVTPVFFGLLMKDTLPGRPDFWVENGVWLSAALCASAALTLVMAHRHRRRSRI